MPERFSVRTTPHFDRLAKALRRRNNEFTARYRDAIAILVEDPYNHSRAHPIRKAGRPWTWQGQWRLRLGGWRFRYDIEGSDVALHFCGLRDESTYR